MNRSIGKMLSFCVTKKKKKVLGTSFDDRLSSVGANGNFSAVHLIFVESMFTKVCFAGLIANFLECT